MMKKFLVALVIAVVGLFCILQTDADELSARHAPLQQADCAADAPLGYPKDAARGTVVCHTAYVLKHDDSAKIPVWVSYVLTAEETTGCFPRTNAFTADPKLQPGSRAEVADYAKSGYDRGHIANDADMTWSETTERESFYMSNMTPQTHAFNAGIWKELESSVRNWAFTRKHELLIYAGPIYSASDKTIGVNKVVVPHAFYKIVTDMDTKESLAFLFDADAPPGGDLHPYLTSVADVEKISGIEFDVPGNKQSVGTLWPGKVGDVAKAKKEACKSAG